MTQTQETEKTIKNGLEKAKHDTAAMAEQASAQIEKGLEAAQETVNQAAEQTAKELRKINEQGTAFVRENPGLAVAGALGVGVLLGIALRGRD
ncbi:hypothetical protein DS901_11400 [Loktanella sp. D2R18]|uniref:DUF883 family protein n=1 Tax=Rhodobacterales TaxID=204455 RepID=UPI000DEA3C44|nr:MULTISPECIES: DUF883 family protein [Rhodobacterales]MDO6590350.1 DUF883 family protein [Yoonia sp. 1_MG-2023]RBW42849.1 hypothetical protein DS901_11400 [Loktanella sp. D2R18]